MSQKQDLQNAHSTKFLNYGHLGRTIYYQEEKTWKTLRNIESHGALHTDDKRLGEGFGSAFPLPHLFSNVAYEGFAIRQSWDESQAIGRNHDESDSGPSSTSNKEARAAETFGGDNERMRSCLLDLAEPNFGTRSETLAFGGAVSTALDGTLSENVYIPIAASISGITGQSVRLARIDEEILQGGEGREEPPLRVPSISKKYEGFWTSNSGPIQQICFAAQTGYASTWMAVRLLSSTTICHPLIHDQLVPSRHETNSAPSAAMRRSKLDANPVITIPMSRTGGHPHADITFHPRDYSKLAMIDEHGNWSVWTLIGRVQESPCSQFKATLLCSGKIWTWDFERRLRNSLPYHDGWHRISWCADPETDYEDFFVCNRRTAGIYNTSGDLLGLIDLRLGHGRENQWILDVKPITSLLGHYLVLTSTCLFWLYVENRQNADFRNDQNTPQVLLAWQHFRDRGDRTLHLVLLETGLTTVVLVASLLVDMVSVFRIGLLYGHKALPASLADPFNIFLPESPHNILSGQRPRSLLFHAIECRYDGELDGAVSKSLFKLYSMHADFSVIEHIYRSTEPGFRPTGEAATPCILSLPTQELLSRPAPKQPRQRDLEDFIVLDDWVEGDEDCIRTRRCESDKIPRERSIAQPKRYLDWQDVYSHLLDENKSITGDARTQVDVLLTQFRDHFNQSMLPGVHLLSEILSSRLHITDIDDDSEHLESLISTFNSQQRDDGKLVRFSVSPFESKEPPGLTSIYDAIVANHLAPLLRDAPDRVRVNKERLARKITADLFLASTALCPILPSSTDGPTADPLSQQPSFQPTNPYPSPADTISQPTSSSSNTLATSIAEEDPVITRLCTYITISPPTSSVPIPPISTNPTLSSILRHLPTSPDSDPTSYSWRATERSLAAEQENEAALAADPRARRKAEKAKLARERREEARKRKFAEDAVRSQRVMPTVMSSQVVSVGDAREVQSSQVQARDDYGLAGSSQGQRQDLPMTQPETGLFGARPSIPVAGFGSKKLTKGKKRAAGF